EIGNLLTQQMVDAFDATRGHAQLSAITSSDPLGREHFQPIGFEQVVPTVEQDAALEALADLVHVVRDASEGGDVALPQLLTVALHAAAVATMHDAVLHKAAGDHTSTSLERLAHLGVTLDDLFVPRLEHAREQLLDVLDERVDDVVLAYRDTLRFRCATRLCFSLDVEGDDHRLRSDGEVDVVDVHVAESGVYNLGA